MGLAPSFQERLTVDSVPRTIFTLGMAILPESNQRHFAKCFLCKSFPGDMPRLKFLTISAEEWDTPAHSIGGLVPCSLSSVTIS